MRLLPHDFHVAHGAVTLSIMSLKVAIPRLVLLPVLLLTVAIASCSGSGFREGEGTIWIRVTGWEGHSGLGVEHCRGSVGPNAILKDISVRDQEGTEIAHMTVRGQDATVKRSRNGWRCVIRAEMKVEGVPIGPPYVVVADGETTSVGYRWRYLDDPHACFGACDTRTLAFKAVSLIPRGDTETAEIRRLVMLGYLRAREIAGIWEIDRERFRRIVERPDFPNPAEVVGSTKFWLPEALEAWRLTRRDSSPEISE